VERPPGAPICYCSTTTQGKRVFDAKSFICKACDHKEACEAFWNTEGN
jgi:hypothetical protein